MERIDGSQRPPEDLDLRLREALEPPPEAVARIVRGALAERSPARGLRLAPVAAVLAVLAFAAALLVRVQPPRREAVVSIETVGEVIVVRPRQGPASILSSGGPRREAPPGTLIMIYGGGE